MWQATSLKRKLIASSLAAAILPLAAVGWISLRQQENAAIAETFARLDGIASAQVGHLEAIVEGDLELSTLITTNEIVRGGLTAEIGPARVEAALREQLRAGSRLLSVTVFDASGRVVAGTDDDATLGLGVAAGPEQSTALVGHVQSDDEGTPKALTSTDVVVDGRRVGRVVIETDVGPILEIATNYEGLGSTGETSIAELDANGDAELIAPPRFAPGGPLGVTVPASNEEAPITRALAGEQGHATDARDYRDEAVLAVTRTVEGTGWGVVVKIDRAEALEGSAALRDELLVAGAFALALGALVALLGTRWVTRPIRRLTELADAAARGEHDQPIEPASRDEVGVLAESVGTMRDALVSAEARERGRAEELERLRAELDQRDASVRAIVETATEGIVHVRDDGAVLTCNRAASAVFGRAAEEVIGRSFSELVEPPIGSPLPRASRQLLEIAVTMGPDGMELAARHPDGTATPVHVSVSPVETGDETTYTALIRDISERIAYERQLSHLATHDGLTGLPNRDLFVHRLELAIDQRRYRDGSVAILFVDLDRFKVVNDHWGHSAGDDLLVEVAARLSRVVRSADVIARFGGDEFVILLDDVEDQGAPARLAQRIVRALADPFPVRGGDTYVSASIGIAATRDPDTTAEDLLRDADVAMYRAKNEGGSRVAVFDAELRAWLRDRHELDTELRRAIEAGDLTIAYQPIHDLETGRYRAAEALVRWSHPELGEVPPSVFIPVAEASGLILQLGRYVLSSVCRQIAQWDREHGADLVQIALNVTARELLQPDFLAAVRAALTASGARPAHLRLEVTESILLENTDEAIDRLGELHDMGITIALDDFGTGYSSLTHLRRLPIDFVKIDRSFVAELGTPHDSGIARLVLALGASLGIAVIAEGVETTAQRDAFLRLGGRWAQGFLFAEPQTAERAESLIWATEERFGIDLLT